MLSDQEVREIVEIEGLGYAVADYMSGDNIENPILRALWITASKALKALEAHLEKIESHHE